MINQNLNLTPEVEATWLVFNGEKVVVHRESKALPDGAWGELSFAHEYSDCAFSLDSEHASTCYVVDMGNEMLEHEAWDLVSLRGLLLHLPAHYFEVISRAWQLVHFRRTHKYCGQCGSTMQQVNWEMAMQCHNCGHRCYPRISPCIIVAIRDDDRLLLAMGRAHQSRQMYSTLAGFVESGESLEQTVDREVFEEVGVKVKNLEYFGSQPWPFPHSLMIGFLAEYAGGDICIDDDEIVDANWYEIDSLPNIPPKFSIAGKLIDETVKRIQASKSK